jgi:hypothetical protein
MSQTAAVAAEYEQRLSRLLAERFGGGESGLARVADRAAPYLPNVLVPRLRQLIADLAALRSGRAEVDDIEKFGASADAVIAAVAAALPTSRPQERRGSLRRAVFWHLLVALAVPFVGLALSYELKINTPLLVGILLFWAWGGYLYWVIDRIIQVWLVPSAIRGGLRTIVAFLFFWCPVALVWAVLLFIDWRRAKYGTKRATPHEASSIFDDDQGKFTVNPTTGLPMMGSGDIGGNPYGFFGKSDN